MNKDKYEVRIETSKGTIVADINKITELEPLLLQNPNYTEVKVKRIGGKE